MNVFSLDISLKMIEEDHRVSPDIEFEQGDVFDLKFEKNSLAGIVAFYLIVNFPEEVIPDEIMELVRRRQQARAEKRWQEADTLRDQITAAGYEVQDTLQGPRVQWKSKA